MARRRLVVALLVTLALLVVGGAGFVAFVSWKSADALVHPARSASTATPAAVGLAFESVSFVTSDGVSFSGWWMPAPTANEGTVVFLHGYGDNKAQSIPFAPFLAEAGFSVFAFDFRAHGASGGAHTTVGLDETRDVAAALAYLRARADVDPDRIALMGLSMGAATAIRAAAEDQGVAAVVADSAFANLQNVASNSIERFTGLPRYPYGPLSVLFAGWMVGRDVSENEPAVALRSVTAPILLIQGSADPIARAADDGEALRAAAPGAAYWLVDGAHHVAAHTVAKDEYEARVVRFLRETLG